MFFDIMQHFQFHPQKWSQKFILNSGISNANYSFIIVTHTHTHDHRHYKQAVWNELRSMMKNRTQELSRHLKKAANLKYFLAKDTHIWKYSVTWRYYLS